MSEDLPPESIQYQLGALWGHKPPSELQFQIPCSTAYDPHNTATLEVIHSLLNKVAATALGRLAHIQYSTEFKLPAAILEPMVIGPAGPAVRNTLTQIQIPPGYYFLSTTDATSSGADARLRLIRSMICALCGKAGAHGTIYEGVVKYSPEPGLSFSTPAFEVPRAGFWSVLAHKDRAELLLEAFVGAFTGSEGAAALDMFSAALDQKDRTAKHILYWAALESLVGAKHLGNRLSQLYGVPVPQLDSVIPYNHLKDGRDGATHHGRRSALSQADERILQGIFVDLLAHALSKKPPLLGPELWGALRDR